MKSNEDICAVLYLKEHMPVGPISFCAVTVLELFVEWNLLGCYWLFFVAIGGVCCCNYISVLIITKEVIIECVELFRVHGRVTISKLSLLEFVYNYSLSFILRNETTLSIVLPHLLWFFFNIFILSYIYYWLFAFVHPNAQPTSILSFWSTSAKNILEDGKFINVVFYHFDNGIRIDVGVFTYVEVSISRINIILSMPFIFFWFLGSHLDPTVHPPI